MFSHADAGADIRLKLNKSSAADTASCVFQSNWSGRAEFGIAGNNDFSIKTSDDGSNWRTSLVCESATAKVNFPEGLGTQSLGVANKINLFSNAGRLAVETEVTVSTFSFPSAIELENGATVSGFAKFVTDSVDYGGTAAANQSDVKSLADNLRSANAARHLPEFWVSEVVVGSGASHVTSVSGSSHYRVLGLNPILNAAAATSFYIKAKSGSLVISAEDHDVWIDGTKLNSHQEILSSDGWLHVNVLSASILADATNRHEGLIPIFATSGDRFLLALPALLPDAVRVSPNVGLVASLS